VGHWALPADPAHGFFGQHLAPDPVCAEPALRRRASCPSRLTLTAEATAWFLEAAHTTGSQVDEWAHPYSGGGNTPLANVSLDQLRLLLALLLDRLRAACPKCRLRILVTQDLALLARNGRAQEIGVGAKQFSDLLRTDLRRVAVQCFAYRLREPERNRRWNR
jgi:hypothetical protein